MRSPRTFVCCAALLALAACRGKPKTEPRAAPSASAEQKPLDHLATDELAPSKLEVWGFPVPVGMEVESRLPDRAYLRGRIPPEALSNYVRQQVVVSHVEVGAARTVFPSARIKAGPADRFFNLEVLPDSSGTRLAIKDVTPPPPPPPGLSDAERWRAAGLGPDGRPLDPKKLE
jgi:hypothetical protein